MAWVAGAMSPTSSRKRVPPSACSNLPIRRRSAPVKAPRSWPNSSPSRRASGIAAQLIARKGPRRGGRADRWPGRRAPCRSRSRPVIRTGHVLAGGAPDGLVDRLHGGRTPTIRSASASAGSSSSSSRARTWVRRPCSMARASTPRSSWSSSGLRRYSKAPRFMASIAVSVAAKAVMMMTGSRGSMLADLVEGVQARHVGEADVQDDRRRPASADQLDAVPGGARGDHVERRRTSGSPGGRRARWARRRPRAASAWGLRVASISCVGHRSIVTDPRRVAGGPSRRRGGGR